MQVQLLLTGNELMSGDIIDSNSVMIAQKLKDIGIEIKRKVTVSDDIELLISEISHISQQADILIVNGGLGPTTDDLTAEALAKAANIPLVQHEEALSHITSWCEKRGAKLNAPNLKQTILPENCNIIANGVGSAVGFHLNINDCDIYCTPGVPHELRTMLNNEISPILERRLPNHISCHTTRFQVFGYGESDLQKLLSDKLPNWPSSLEIGYRASLPILELKVTSYTAQDKILKEQWLLQIKDLLGHHIIDEVTQKPSSLASNVLSLLQKHNKTLTTAESCTGGLISSLLTKESGASNAFHAAFVTYSNEIKTSVLGVPKSVLDTNGAVSEETVIAMAKGALKQSSSDYVIAVSGIAGPSGGSADKPVGSFWLAWGTSTHIKTITLNIKANRYYFQQMVSAIGLDLIRRELLSAQEEPIYFSTRK